MACNRLPNTATKQELLDAHKVKMAAKKIVHQHYYEQFSADYQKYKEWLEDLAKKKREKEVQHVL